MTKVKILFKKIKWEFQASWGADSPYSKGDIEWMRANPGKAAVVWAGWVVMATSMVAAVLVGMWGLTELSFMALRMLG